MNLSDIVQYLPTIATALVNPVAGIGQLAAQFFGPKIGVAGTIEAVTQKLAGLGPEEIVKLKEIDSLLQQHLSDNGIVLALAQVEVQKIEASSTNWFIAAARPYIVWVCGIGLTYQLLLQPIFTWLSINLHWIAPPTLDGATLGATVSALLGLGTMRSFEKYNGVHNDH